MTATHRPLGKTGLQVSAIGFGAFKIGRNQNVKYPKGYNLPDETAVAKLLNAVLDAGINYIDTAPAYGLSEERIGRAIASRRDEYVLSTKVGETFVDGVSTYDFSKVAIEQSIERSLKRLQTEMLDLVFIHSNGDDFAILNETDVVETLQRLQQSGKIRYLGLSGKDPAAAKTTFAWADALMVEYHLQDQSHADIITEASTQGVGVIIKKGLAAGHLSPTEAIPFLLKNEAVSSIVIGGLNIEHIRANLATAIAVGQAPA